MFSSTASKIITSNLPMTYLLKLNRLLKDHDNEVFPGMSPITKRILVLTSKWLSGNDDVLCSQLMQYIVMIRPRNCGRDGTSLQDHLLFFAWTKVAFPFIRIVAFSSVGPQGDMLMPLRLVTCAKEETFKEGKYNALTNIKKNRDIVINAGHADKITCPRRQIILHVLRVKINNLTL